MFSARPRALYPRRGRRELHHVREGHFGRQEEQQPFLAVQPEQHQPRAEHEGAELEGLLHGAPGGDLRERRGRGRRAVRLWMGGGLQGGLLLSAEEAPSHRPASLPPHSSQQVQPVPGDHIVRQSFRTLILEGRQIKKTNIIYSSHSEPQKLNGKRMKQYNKRQSRAQY